MTTSKVSTSQIKGVILEEFVLRLLNNAGYRIIDGNENAYDIRDGHNGLQLQGRGEWHQTDALVAYDHTPAFIYPIRLIVEAKAYSYSYRKGKVGIDIIRNAVGILKDVNENYFSLANHRDDNYKLKRFNYAYAIFSLNGFSMNAQRYALAHQIFLIQYYHSRLFHGVRKSFKEYDDYIKMHNIRSFEINVDLTTFRTKIRIFFSTRKDSDDVLISRLPLVIRNLLTSLKRELSNIKGSYFGLLNGEYPVHVLSNIVIDDIEEELKVEVRLEEPGLVHLELPNRILLSFELPDHIARIFQSTWDDRLRLANEKSRLIKYISLTGRFSGKHRSVILKLDDDWLNKYIGVLQED